MPSKRKQKTMAYPDVKMNASLAPSTLPQEPRRPLGEEETLRAMLATIISLNSARKLEATFVRDWGDYRMTYSVSVG